MGLTRLVDHECVCVIIRKQIVSRASLEMREGGKLNSADYISDKKGA